MTYFCLIQFFAYLSYLYLQANAIIYATQPFGTLHVTEAWRQILGPANIVSPMEQTRTGVALSLLEELQVFPFQKELVHRLASDCAIGIPGSAIFMSSARQSNGAAGEPLVLYLKVSCHLSLSLFQFF